MKRKNSKGIKLVEGKNYKLVNKNRYRDGGICVFYVWEDANEDMKGLLAFLANKLYNYDDLIVGDIYRVSKEKGFFNYSKTCCNISNEKP